MPYKPSSSAEEDPLLPRSEGAPEIHSGTGYAQSDSAEVTYSTFDNRQHQHEDLLPSYQAGNEINTYGGQYGSSDYSEPYGSKIRDRNRRGEGYNNDEQDDSADSSGPSATRRALNTLISLFMTVVFFSMVAMALNGGGLSKRPGGSPPTVPVPSHGSGTSSSALLPRPTSDPKKTVEERVHDILTSTPLLDGHNDLAIFLRALHQNNITSPKFREEFEKGPMAGDVDMIRLRKGMVGGGFWSAFVACPVPSYRSEGEAVDEEGKNWKFLDEDYSVPVSHTFQQIDLLKRIQRQYPDDFSPAGPDLDGHGSTRETMLSDWKKSGGRKLFGTLSIEGLHQLSPSSPLASLRLLYDLGVRAATLTWNCHNAFADASLVWNGLEKEPEVVDTKKVRGGLTKRGRQVVREMNRLGMLVDISHTSYTTQLAVLGFKHESTTETEIIETRKQFEGASIAPVIFSHSSAHVICPHPRNVRDDVLDQVKRTGSLVMVNFSPDFISCVPAKSSSSHSTMDKHKLKLPDFYEKNNTLHQVARHIMYIGNRIGFAHVGLGSDFDGMGELKPRGLEGVDKYPDLVAELLRMGVTDEQARGIAGGNLLRVWEDVEKVAASMRSRGVEEGVDEVTGW